MNEAENPHEIKDARTLKKYILPSLASTGIYLEMGSRKVGFYLCKTAPFRKLAKDIKRNAKCSSSDPSVDEMSSITEEKLLMELGEVFKSKVKIIDESKWSLLDFILCVPVDLWRRKVIVGGSNRYVGVGQQQTSGTYIFMMNGPAVRQSVQLTFISARIMSIESCVQYSACWSRMILIFRTNRAKGLWNYSLTLSGYMRADKEFMRLLNRVGITAYCQSSQRIKNVAIYQQIEQGAFSQTARSAFRTIAVDNVNVHASHSVAVHSKTYH